MRASSGVRFYLGVLACSFAVVASVASCKTRPKTPACAGNEDCIDGLICVNQLCVQCSKDSDCGDGRTCKSGACTSERCTTDADCAGGKVCQAGLCQPCLNN